MTDEPNAAWPSRTELSRAVHDLGWRFILGYLRAAVGVRSLREAAEVAALALTAAGADADGHLSLDLRPDQVQLGLRAAEHGRCTGRDVELARAISAAVGELGLRTEPQPDGRRPLQYLEIAIDALDIPAVRPFWRAVLGYGDEPGESGPEDQVVDPAGQGPAVWFQQMDEPRPQRNRIHIDISVSHDEAPRRLQAALDAGGMLVTDAYAPAFWVLSDVEGNEVCVCTWQGRDPDPA